MASTWGSHATGIRRSDRDHFRERRRPPAERALTAAGLRIVAICRRGVRHTKHEGPSSIRMYRPSTEEIDPISVAGDLYAAAGISPSECGRRRTNICFAPKEECVQTKVACEVSPLTAVEPLTPDRLDTRTRALPTRGWSFEVDVRTSREKW